MAIARTIQSRIELSVIVKTTSEVNDLKIKCFEEAVQKFANEYMKETFPRLEFGK